MLDALKHEDVDMDATAIQAIYQVDSQAVAEEIVARACLLRRMRKAFADGPASGESWLDQLPKCS